MSEFLLANLLSVLSAKAVRTGRSPLKDKIGQCDRVPRFTLIDDADDPSRTGTVGFDREGLPTSRKVLVRDGVLEAFLYDSYEARVARRAPTVATPAAAPPRLPSIGAVEPDRPRRQPALRAALLRALPRRPRCPASPAPATRSPASSPASSRAASCSAGERTPIREVQISGNLYDALNRISGVSREVRLLDGNVHVPAVRIDDVSVTAGLRPTKGVLTTRAQRSRRARGGALGRALRARRRARRELGVGATLVRRPPACMSFGPPDSLQAS